MLDPEGRAIDTRVAGYDAEAKRTLDQRYGAGQYTGWQLWDEIQKQDTIVHANTAQNSYIYTSRLTIRHEELISQISIGGERRVKNVA